MVVVSLDEAIVLMKPCWFPFCCFLLFSLQVWPVLYVTKHAKLTLNTYACTGSLTQEGDEAMDALAQRPSQVTEAYLLTLAGV